MRRRPTREKLGLLMGGAGDGQAASTKEVRHAAWCLKSAPSARRRSRIISPLIAIALTLATMAVLFALLGKNPIDALDVYFLEPLTDPYSLQEIAVKATPLVLIAVGLSLCYLANVWNIGAEGQFIMGAVCGQLARRHYQRHRRRTLGAAGDAGARRARRRALCDDPGDLQGALRRQRNPHQPDAGLCRRPDPGLSGARAVARSEGPQFPDHRVVRSGRHRADLDRRRPPARRLDRRPDRGDAGNGDAWAHHQGF